MWGWDGCLCRYKGKHWLNVDSHHHINSLIGTIQLASSEQKHWGFLLVDSGHMAVSNFYAYSYNTVIITLQPLIIVSRLVIYSLKNQETVVWLVQKFAKNNLNSTRLLLFIYFCSTTILWCHWLPYFGLRVTFPTGFKARVVLSYILTCLHAVDLRVTSGATPAFSTTRGVHCINSII